MESQCVHYKTMSVESILSITASLIAIGGLVYAGYQRCKKKSLSTLMTELVAKNTSVKGQQGNPSKNQQKPLFKWERIVNRLYREFLRQWQIERGYISRYMFEK